VAGQRTQQLADRIKVIVASLLERRIKDPRLGFVTITDVRLTGDNQNASVFYTVLGGVGPEGHTREAQEAIDGTAAALRSATGLIRSEVGKQLGVRQTPTIEFFLDAVPESAQQIEDLLAKARQSDEAVAAAAAGAQYARRSRPLQEAQRRGRRLGGRVTDAPVDGIVVVDKPAGWTSHDVVARARRTLATRKIGHAGTLDPMATGVLVLGVGRATRLLGHLTLAEKIYDATVRLGARTNTDDAEGETTATSSAVGIAEDDVRRVLSGFIGEVDQVPSAVSAVKVDGKRAYARVRAGEDVQLAARKVTVHEATAGEFRRDGDFLDFDLHVRCSSGTYIRAIARDVGEALGVGGHLTSLRRTRVGPFGLDGANADLENLAVTPLADAARQSFPVVELDDAGATAVRFGRALVGVSMPAPGPVALFAPDHTFLALYEQRGSDARAVAVFV
jgi:tRNA pseudouridine55 synthase